jgi:hypothetical protein
MSLDRPLFFSFCSFGFSGSMSETTNHWDREFMGRPTGEEVLNYCRNSSARSVVDPNPEHQKRSRSTWVTRGDDELIDLTTDPDQAIDPVHRD